MIQSIRISTPDDMHLHVRQGDRMKSAVSYAAMHFGRAIIMPNTAPQHIVTVDRALEYRQQILNAVPQGASFEPLMTLSLKPETTPEIITRAKSCEFIHGIKLYAGHTTNSAGFEDMNVFYSALAEMEKRRLPLLIHGEAASHVDVFDREEVFYKNTMTQIRQDFPDLRIVCEHITTRTACQFVLDARANVAATITPQHLLVNRNYMLGSGLRPDAYCMPILKREEDREALLSAATSGNPKFFLGTDSAPHPTFGEAGKAKYTSCGCAGCFSSPVALALYAEAFDSVNALHKLSDFASKFGREFYGLSANEGQIILTRESVSVDAQMEFGETQVPVFRAEQPLQLDSPQLCCGFLIGKYENIRFSCKMSA
jgi:dihydroorotase